MDDVEIIPPLFTWDRRRYELRKRLLADQIDDFKTWPTVNESLYTADSPAAMAELKILKASGDWDRWRIIEDQPTNGTLIHQAYSLWQWETFTGRHVEDLASIAEFGAGYGEMAKLCFDLGFTGTYYIFDFPELIQLQKSFIGLNHQIVYCDDIERWQGKHTDLFIAICSLSEAPVKLRNQFLSASQSNLIRFQDWFDNVDNSWYFQAFATRLQSYKVFRCEHFTPHWYLISEANTDEDR